MVIMIKKRSQLWNKCNIQQTQQGLLYPHQRADGILSVIPASHANELKTQNQSSFSITAMIGNELTQFAPWLIVNNHFFVPVMYNFALVYGKKIGEL